MAFSLLLTRKGEWREGGWPSLSSEKGRRELPLPFLLQEKGDGLLSFPKRKGRREGGWPSLLLKRKEDPPSPLKGRKWNDHPLSLLFLLLRREAGCPSLFSLARGSGERGDVLISLH